MDINNIFLVIFTTLALFTILLVFLNSFEFFKLDKDQFRGYILGLIIFFIAMISFLFRYIFFPPLSDFESFLTGYLANISPLFGLFLFLRETSYLAKKDNEEFIESTYLIKITYVMLISTIIYEFFYIPFIFVSQDIFDTLGIFGGVLYLVSVVLTILSLLTYRNVFTDLLGKVVFWNISAITSLLIGAVIIVESLAELEADGITFTDLNTLNTAFSVFGVCIVFIPIFLAYLKIHLFRKKLVGS